jgi:hypothetical protein
MVSGERSDPVINIDHALICTGDTLILGSLIRRLFTGQKKLDCVSGFFCEGVLICKRGQMDTTTLLIIILVILLLGGGGYYGRGRWF